MNNLNSILIEGNLTRDPIIAETPKGTQVCNFSVASNRFYKQEDELQKEVSFFDVEVWSRQAEICAETLAKGRGVRVVGRLKQDRWTDDGGAPHARVKIVAEHVEFKPEFKKRKNGDGDDASAEDEILEESSTEEQAQEEEAAAVAEQV
jgi:single-strand DNA-binding protein